jgi:hypothetical protein
VIPSLPNHQDGSPKKMYEDRHTPPLPRGRFLRRMADHVALAAAIVGVSLLVGMWGYEHYEHLPWRDAFLNTAMLLGGMGPVDPLRSNGGKLFAGIFALYAGVVFLVVAGLFLVPVIHRIAHLFHFEGKPR